MLKRTVTQHHKAAFEALFGIAIINAQNLYVEYNGEKVQIYQFWEKLMVGTLWTHVQAAFYGHMFKQHFMDTCSSSILWTHVQTAFYGHMFKQHIIKPFHPGNVMNSDKLKKCSKTGRSTDVCQAVTKSLSKLVVEFMHKSTVTEYQHSVLTAQIRLFCGYYVSGKKHSKIQR